MSTQTEQTAPNVRAPYSVSVWDVVPCLIWAAVGFGLLSGWMWARSSTRAGTDDLDLGAPFYIGPAVLAVISLAVFLWITVSRVKCKGDPSKLGELEGQTRNLLWLLSLIGGGVLLALALWLFLAERNNHVFPEVSSMAAMGLICLLGSASLRHTTQSVLSQHGILQWLVNIRRQLAIALLIIGVGFCIWGGPMLYRAGRADFGRFPGGPEGIGLILIGLVFLAAGLFTQLTLERASTGDTMRFLALYLGSMTGLVITMATAMRVWWWWKAYLVGGVRSWQGPEAWRFWLCAYVALFGLLLLFGSLLLARVDIRVNAGIRRVLYGYNAVFTGLLLLALLVLANIMVAVVFTANVEWNPKMGMQSLSSRSKTTLEGLKDRVTVYVLMARGSESYLEVRDLLDNCQTMTDKLTVQEISPDLKEMEYRKLVDKYPEVGERTSLAPGSRGDSGRGLLITYGEAAGGQKLPHEFIPESDLEGPDQGRTHRLFFGERVLMEKIRLLSEKGKNKPKIYVTQDNGELWIDDGDYLTKGTSDRVLNLLRYAGGGEFATMLRKDNFEVQGLIWESKPNIPTPEMFSFSKASPKDKHEVPDDCSVLLIANPENKFSKDVLEAIDRYMDKRNGKLMILTNTGILPESKIADDGLVELCKKYNVQLNKDFVLKFSPRDDVMKVKVTVVPTAQNKVAQEFVNQRYYFVMPRTMSPMKGPSSGYNAEPFLHVTKEANGAPVGAETDTAAILKQHPADYVATIIERGQLGNKVSPEPLIVGMTVTDRDNKARVIVIGGYTFVSTPILRKSTDARDNFALFRSCLSWLADRDMIDIGIDPKESGTYHPRETSKTRLVVLPIALLALALAGLGTGIWIVRRK